MKPAYWIARSRIIDPEKYFEYVRKAGPASQQYGSRILSRGGRFEILEGSREFERFVLVQYPSFDAAMEFYHSQAYQEAAAFRLAGAGINELVIVEGEDSG
ncbi:DUF1330 domain-containing protein [Sphingomonas sp. PR090111-T3T-6A]|uniref:DUF1330 domain-containing protein n=1 Tax=Sphingomonas sp. PR090111-T3T-6A TaxID=685778 RepID=UPI000477B74F|nr:DUF1330 domain-containing protein [Sphingomonas sp. PR090111-T3T-6A]